MKKINIILMLGILLSVIVNTGCDEPEDEDEFAGDAGTFTDQRDDNTYNWVRIGEQIWMAENLAYYNDTKSIAYNADFNNVELYGYLYSSPNIEAPEGWHIPNKYEFLQLINYVTSTGYSNEEAYVLKSTIGWGSQFNGLDLFGFRALPGGTAVLNNDGTGYYYTPWYGAYYYPRPVTWGYGVHWNPYSGWGFSIGILYTSLILIPFSGSSACQ